MEIAELNESFDDGTVYHMHFVLDPATGNSHVHTQFPINSIDSDEGLNQPFTEANASEAVSYHGSFNGSEAQGTFLILR